VSPETLKAGLRQSLRPVATWRMQDAATRSDFDLNQDVAREVRSLRPAAVLVAVIAAPEGPSVILTRRSDGLTRHGGQIAFPGGRIEPGETAVDAALREAREEVELDPGAVEVLGLGDAYETGTGFLVTPVIGWLTARPRLVPCPDEVADIFEVPWDFLMDQANHRRDFLEPQPGVRRWFWSMPWQDRNIWGVTAGIVRVLHDRLVRPAVEDDAA